MAFLTDRKRAIGLGASKTGTEHFISMQVSAVALIILMPLFLLTFGTALGGTYDEVVAHFARPYPAIITALTLIVGLTHFKKGVQTLIEDYVHGTARKLLIVFTIILSYAAMATGLFAIARLAF